MPGVAAVRLVLLRHRRSHGGGAMSWARDRRARGEMRGARIGRTFGVCAPARRRCAVPCARCGSGAQTIRNPPRAQKFAARAKIRRGAQRCPPRPPPALPRGGGAPYLAAAAAEDPTAALLQAAGAPLALRAPLGGASAPATELRPDRATAPSSRTICWPSSFNGKTLAGC